MLERGSKMQVATKIFFVAFWASFYTLTENKECLKDNINFEYVQKGNLLDSYESGQTVRLSCVTGYAGHLKIECDNGQWRKIGERDCKKKPCGHPGDTPNGDFKLIKESEFVFGATVEYSCRTGYMMASRVKYRNCRSDGWDNAVPVCEVVKCPMISHSDDVIVSGNIEEASFGDVIHFECASTNMMLDGSEYIHCADNGQWSDTIPKCTEIKCRSPNIEHGYIIHVKEYRENDILQYSCDPGHNPRHGVPRCTKYGWSITPECEEINCLLGSRTIGVISTKPIGKNIFKVREKVEIFCSETYWVIGTKQTSKEIACKDNGQFETTPGCEEITCDHPDDENLSSPSRRHHWGPYKLNQFIQYTCKNGYRKTAERAKCTENGWEPKPLCTEITCEKPEVEHATVVGTQKVTYKTEERVTLKCDDGYEPEHISVKCSQQGTWEQRQRCQFIKPTCPKPSVSNGLIRTVKQGYLYSCSSGYKTFNSGNWWEVVTCTEGKLSHTPLCIPERQCGQTPNVQITEVKVYDNGETVTGKCEPETCCFKCVRGVWNEQDCESKGCGTPPHVENSVITSHSQQQVKYECRNNYKINGNEFISCFNSEWEKHPTCELDRPHSCPKPEEEINNATLIIVNLKTSYEEGNTVEYKCKEGFQYETVRQATCSKGQWNYPRCVQLDRSQSCPQPEGEINNAKLIKVNLKAFYLEGNTVEYKCKEGFQNETVTQATCSKKQWIYPRCVQLDRSQSCPQPEGEINNAKLIKVNLKAFYLEGNTVEYKCKEGFQNETVTQATCSKKQWIYPRCVQLDRPQTCPEPEREINNTTLNKDNQTASYEEGNTVEYKCKEGFQNETMLQATCSKGQWIYPQCVKLDRSQSCPQPEGEINNARLITVNLKGSYKEGNTVEYKCKKGFQYETVCQAKCSKGQWNYPRCVKNQ